jgi:hypothetical protein
MKLVVLPTLALLLLPLTAHAKADCPTVVTGAVAKAHPDATIRSCKREVEDGRPQWEMRIEDRGHFLELDIAANGTILQTEEKIALAAVPAVVKAAFGAKYPKTQPTRAEKQTRAGGKVFYELAFTAEQKQREATFAQDGRFVEEE